MVLLILGCAATVGDTGTEAVEGAYEALAVEGYSWAVQRDDLVPEVLSGAAWGEGWPPEVTFTEAGAVRVEGEEVTTWETGAIDRAEDNLTERSYQIDGEPWSFRGVGEPGACTWSVCPEAGECFGLYPWPEP